MRYPAQIVVSGKFESRQIIYRRQPRPKLPPEADAFVARVWDEVQARRRTEGRPEFTPGEMLSLQEVLDHSAVGMLECRLVDSSYPRFMATTRSEFAQRWPQFVMPAFAALAVTVSADDKLVLGLRSGKIDYGRLYHVAPACRVTPAQETAYKAIVLEMGEELGLTPSDLTHLECIGVVADWVWARLCNELVFMSRTSLTFAEIVERAQTAKSKDEHDRLVPVDWQPEAVQQFLLRQPGSFVPTGFAAVALALRHEFGQTAFPDWEWAHCTYDEHVQPVVD